jgi:cystathionine beta-synthase
MTEKPTMDVLDSVLDAVGNNPLIRLGKLGAGVPADLLVKAEFLNPGGSVKDRIGIRMIEAAARAGNLNPGGTIVECTSGNTGMGLAMAAAVLGYRAVFTMPDKMSAEKINLLKAMGAEVVVTPTAVPPDSPESYYKVAERIVRETPGAFHANQYHNPANPQAHYESTGPEIWRQTAGRITHFVATLGTGGTISGTGRYLKEKNPEVKVIGVDPEGSILKDYFETKRIVEAKPYKVEGIGEDMIPSTLQFDVLDEVVRVNDKESFIAARRLAREEGLLVGGSCGSALAGALKALAGTREGDVAVVLLPDVGTRYLSKFYNDEWMRDNGFVEPQAIAVKDVLAHKRATVPALISVEADRPVREAISLVREHDITFVPVTRGGTVVGTAHETALMRLVFENPAALEQPTETVMDPPLPRLDPRDTVQDAMKVLSKRTPAALVYEGETAVGILTSFDLIDFVSR